MSRPTILHVGGTLYWTMRLYNSSGALVDADSTPTVAVRKNGAAVGDSVTVAKRAATTGIYDCSYNPASEAEGDQFTIEESATISSTAYQFSWQCSVIALENGPGGANTVTITVDDDSDNLLENAEVTIWSNGTIIDRKSTNASGVATLNADDGTYTLVVAVPTGGYSSSTNSSFAVSGATTGSVELTAHVTAPSAVGRVTGYGYTDIDGVVTASTSATLTGVGRPTSGSTSTGLLSNYNATNSSDSNGKVSFTNLIPGASYLLAYAGKTKKWDIPADATGEVAMDTIVGDGT